MKTDSIHIAPRARKRAEAIADHLRERIAGDGLRPGARLPPDWLQADETRASRGTLREALRILQTEGLLRSKPGPGGGLFVQRVDPERALRLLDNLFLFEQPGIAEIYALRKLLEPELAASLAGRLDPEAITVLDEMIGRYAAPPATAEEEYRQRLSELEFHAELARRCPNPLLSFVCIFLLTLLRDMTECRAIYATPQPQLRQSGIGYQTRLVAALVAGDAGAARRIMRAHMEEAETYMLKSAAMRPRRDRR